MTCPVCKDSAAWTKCWACGWTAGDKPEPALSPIDTIDSDRYERGPITVVLPWDALASDNKRKRYRGSGEGAWKQYKDARSMAHNEALRQIAVIPWISSGDVLIAIRFWLPDKKRRDPNNLTKLICDALSDAAYTDDAQVRALSWTAGIDRAHPRAVVEIRGLTERSAS